VVKAVGEASVRYGFEVRHEGELCVEGSMVVVLLDVAEGTKVRWSDEQKALLLEGGAQPPELLSVRTA
jgi:acyl-CoA thioesterase FadM